MSLAMSLRKFCQCAMAPQAMPATDGPWGPHRLRRWHSHQESANPCLALGSRECKHLVTPDGRKPAARIGNVGAAGPVGTIMAQPTTETITRASVGLRSE